MEHTCCFFGHRNIDASSELQEKLLSIIEKLILEYEVNTFLFGSKSEFNSLCHDAVSELQEKYPYLKRIYIRAEFPYISEHYKSYLLQWYEETYYPEKVLNAGKAVYIKRNYEMIDRSQFRVVYFDETYTPKKRGKSTGTRSGTKLAHEYAIKENKTVINLFE